MDACEIVGESLSSKYTLVARDELEAGRAVQLAFLPERSPTVPGWNVWLYTLPADDVGGDVVDHLQIDDQHHGSVSDTTPCVIAEGKRQP